MIAGQPPVQQSRRVVHLAVAQQMDDGTAHRCTSGVKTARRGKLDSGLRDSEGRTHATSVPGSGCALGRTNGPGDATVSRGHQCTDRVAPLRSARRNRDQRNRSMPHEVNARAANNARPAAAPIHGPEYRVITVRGSADIGRKMVRSDAVVEQAARRRPATTPLPPRPRSSGSAGRSTCRLRRGRRRPATSAGRRRVAVRSRPAESGRSDPDRSGLRQRQELAPDTASAVSSARRRP